jgi:hypothetical protein
MRDSTDRGSSTFNVQRSTWHARFRFHCSQHTSTTISQRIFPSWGNLTALCLVSRTFLPIAHKHYRHITLDDDSSLCISERFSRTYPSRQAHSSADDHIVLHRPHYDCFLPSPPPYLENIATLICSPPDRRPTVCYVQPARPLPSAGVTFSPS